MTLNREQHAKLALGLQILCMLLVIAAPFVDHSYFNLTINEFGNLQLIGFLIILFSAGLAFSSMISMNTNFKVQAQPKESADLVTKWPFSMVRNPIYFALLTFCIGWSLVFLSYSAIACTLLLYFALVKKIKLEEYYLNEKFGAIYQEFMRKVPRLFPKIF